MDSRRGFIQSALTALAAAPVVAAMPSAIAGESKKGSDVFHVVFFNKSDYFPINVSFIPSGDFSHFIAPSGAEIAVQLTQLPNDQVSVELFDVTEGLKVRRVTKSITTMNSYTSWTSLGLGMHLLPKG
ncbi:hypothetical protein [Denitratimonas sp. CY0512]|uniref:hypothetical protein n=1 Tax=Denitratimonas sp. CY0512 TaxID=3131940 RepID=UPI0030A496D1